MNTAHKKMLITILCVAVAAILMLGLSGCATVGTKRTVKLHDRLIALIDQLDSAKDAAVLDGTATDDYILQYYDIRQELVNLSPYLPEDGVEIDKDDYKELCEKIETAEAEVAAFVENDSASSQAS